jgi:predicted protein tyrosine phosphatase
VSTWFLSYGFADVLDNLLIGAYPLDAEDVAALARAQIDHVLNLVEDTEYRSGERDTVEAAFAAAGISEERLSLTDFGRLPPGELEDAVQEVNRWLDAGSTVYLHCRAGWQRSAAVAAGVVAIRNSVGIDEALAYVQHRKPSADPLPHQRDDLRRWWTERAAGDRRATTEADVGRAEPPT